MLQLVYGQDAIVTPWICHLLRMQIPPHSVSIGIARDGGLVGAALYHNYNTTSDGRPLFIEISFGTIDKNWATRAIISALLGYPFLQLKVKRIQSTVSVKNRDVRHFLEHLGFKMEGVGRLAWPHGGNAMMYSLLSREFFSSKWHQRASNVLPASLQANVGNSGRANVISSGDIFSGYSTFH